MLPETYKDIVTKTFVERAIRSALLVDDQFPRFDEVIDNSPGFSEKYKESERASQIYKMCRDRDILCDVENNLSNIENGLIVERVRKSDFILLDYHLTADESEISHSIDLLKRLARSHHFNTVVVYTKHPDLKDVWLNIAVNLRGGWKKASEILDVELIEKWDDMQDESTLPSVDEMMLVNCLCDKNHNILRSEIGRQLRMELEGLGIRKKDISKFIISLLHTTAQKRLVQGEGEIEHALMGSCIADEPLWLQSGNVFVAIVQKSLDEVTSEDPSKIFDKLSDALVDWKPNIVQILLSEIQNILELGGLAADEKYTGTPERQTGIGYHLLSLIPPTYEAGDTTGLDAAIFSTVGKITESIQSRVVNDGGMLAMTRELVDPLIASQLWSDLPVARRERVIPLVNLTKTILNQSQSLKNEDVFVDLNTFLSTERFGGVNVTTGTVFSDHNNSSWWLCCSPACDMAPRAPSTKQSWLTEISPSKSIIILQLVPIKKNNALSDAENGTNVFIGDSDTGYKYFNAIPADGHPVWEMMFVSNYGKVSESSGMFSFSGQRMTANSSSVGSGLSISTTLEFIVRAQLRPEYAARLLQMTGQHLSRIGVDFVNFP